MEQPKIDAPLNERIKTLEDNIKDNAFMVTQYLTKSDRELTYNDLALAVEAFKALEDYNLVKEVLMPECVDDEIYILISRDLNEIMEYVVKYFKDNKTLIRDRIKFRISLFRRDIYSFIRGCADILD
jgi:hypothetical protein